MVADINTEKPARLAPLSRRGILARMPKDGIRDAAFVFPTEQCRVLAQRRDEWEAMHTFNAAGGRGNIGFAADYEAVFGSSKSRTNKLLRFHDSIDPDVLAEIAETELDTIKFLAALAALTRDQQRARVAAMRTEVGQEQDWLQRTKEILEQLAKRIDKAPTEMLRREAVEYVEKVLKLPNSTEPEHSND